MVNSKQFNGKFVTDYLMQHPKIWRLLADTLWEGKTQQNKNYFAKKTDINATTLWILHDVTGLPWDTFFIGEGDPQPDVTTIDNRIDIHHNHIDTLNANSNPEVLLAYLEMSRELSKEKDKTIHSMQQTINSLQRDRDELLSRFPAINNCKEEPEK